MMIAIIPARGGSKRIPRKNIREFVGKPMIAYAIEAARATGAFDHIIVSTDDDEIADVAARYGAELPFRRPAELADDTTPTVPVIQHAIESCIALGLQPTHVCCIYPCVPLLQAADLTEARDLLLENGGEGFSFPVARFPSSVQRALVRGTDARVSPRDSEHTMARTQDLEPSYYDAGQFYWGSLSAWRSGTYPHMGSLTTVLPGWRIVDIDDDDDWKRAELIFSALYAR